jgi:hypothetical protein
MATPTDTPRSWVSALAVGVFAVGAAGLLGVAPLWSLIAGVLITAAAWDTFPRWSPWLRRHLSAKVTAMARRPRLAVAIILIAPPLAISAAWDQAHPTTVWIPLALMVGPYVAFHVHAFASRDSDRPTARWWWAWLPLASILVVFFAVGGPFRARWAYCQSRLTAAVTAGEPVEIANTGRFCWHDATERTVDGERRLYFGGADDGDGSGLVYSPTGAIEQSAGLALLRDLGGGWYYFEEGSIVRGFWFDG